MKLRWAAHLAVICTLPFASALLANKDRGSHVPFQVALVKKGGLGSGDSRFVDNFKCSGVLYELDYVWTTKTCLDKFSDKADIIVIAGLSDLTASNLVANTNQRAASEWWKHPNAQVHSWANYDNVGALKLDSAYTADAGKIEVASGLADNNALGGLKGTDVDVTGWGTVTKANPKPTAKLQELNGAKYKLETLPVSDFPKNGEMALSLEKGELERGVCDFDEGSPVFHGSGTPQSLIGITAPGCALSKEPVTASKFDVALGYVHYKGWLDAVKNNNAPTTTPCTTKLTDKVGCPEKTGTGSQHFATLGPVCVQTDPSSATSASSCPRSICTPLTFASPATVNGATTSFDITRTGNSCVDGTAPIHREAKLLSTDGTNVVGTCTVKNSGAAYSCSKTAGTVSTESAIAVVRETSNLKIAQAQTNQIQFTQAAPTIAPGKSQANYLKINGTDKADFATPVKMTWDNTQLVDTKPSFVEFFAVDPLDSSSFSDQDALNAKDRWVRLTDKIDATAKSEEILQIPIPNKQIEEMMHSTTGVTSDVKHYKIITRTTGPSGLTSDFATELEINDREGGGLATDSRQRQMVRDVLYSGNPVQAANMTTKMLDDGNSEDEIREQIANSLANQAKSKSLHGLTDAQGSKAAASVEGFRLLSENADKHDGLTENMYNHYHTYVGNMASNTASKPGYANIRHMMGVTQKLKSFKTSGHKLAIKAVLAGRELKEFQMLTQMTQMLRETAVANYKADNKRVNEAYFACSDGSSTTRDNCAKTQSQTFITAAVSNAAGLADTMGGVTYKDATPAVNFGTETLVQRSTIEYFTASGPNPFDKATVDKEKGLKEWRASSILPELRTYNSSTVINQDFTSGPTATMNIISGTDGGNNLVADRDFCTTRSTVISSSTTLTWKSNPTISGSTFTCPINRVSNQFYSVGYQFKAGEEVIFNSIETDESSDDDGSSSGGSLWFLWAALFIICLCCIVAAVFMMMKKKGKSSTTANNHTAAAPQTSYGMAPPNTTPTDAVPVGNPAPQTHVGDVYGQAAYGNQPPPFFDQDGNPINK